ncbi:MAG: sigma-70 family RNA polymerase sigma factor [Actinomycetota bacterium]|nr:sigma-70 family RNA polymerase sigma factor [Actinomycetota bacterium]
MSAWAPEVIIGSQSDERLVALARAGHEPASAEIVERYRAELVAQARRLDSSGRAEDIVQQTFLSAFTALRSGSDVQHLRGWLHQILRHTAIRSASKERPSAELDPSLKATGSLEDTVESRMLARELLSGLTQLPRRQREAIVEVSIAGRSRAEVSSSMGLTEGAVRQLVHRARATLRTAVTALIPYPLANFLATARGSASADGAADLAVGAGAVSAGGAVIKLGALVSTGVLATAVVTSLPVGHHPKHAPLIRTQHAAATPIAKGHSTPPALVTGAGAPSRGRGTSAGRSPSTHTRPVASARHAHPSTALSGASDGSRGGSGRGGSSNLSGNGSPGGPGSTSTGGQDSPGGSAASRSGGDGSSGGHGQGRTSAQGTGSSGGNGQQSNSGSDGGTQQLSSDGGGSGSGGGSSTSGSGSDNFTASGGGSGSSGGGGGSSSGGGSDGGGSSSASSGHGGDSSSKGGAVRNK